MPTKRFLGIASFRCVALAAATAVWLFAAKRPSLAESFSPPTLPADAFRLTVQEMFGGSDRGVRVLIETVAEQASELAYETPTGSSGRSAWYTMNRSPGGRSFQHQITFLISRASAPDGKHDVLKTVVGQGSVTRFISSNQPTEESFSLTVRDGVYPLDTPLVVGRIDGGDLKLVVGQTPKRRRAGRLVADRSPVRAKRPATTTSVGRCG